MGQLERAIEKRMRERAEGRPFVPRRRSETRTETERSKSEFSKCGPGGQLREHPSMLGLRWLDTVGRALQIHGICLEHRVSAEDWESDGCVSLYLKRPLEGQLVGVNGRPLGRTERYRIPVGAMNSHDMRAVASRCLTSAEKAALNGKAHVLKAVAES